MRMAGTAGTCTTMQQCASSSSTQTRRLPRCSCTLKHLLLFESSLKHWIKSFFFWFFLLSRGALSPPPPRPFPSHNGGGAAHQCPPLESAASSSYPLPMYAEVRYNDDSSHCIPCRYLATQTMHNPTQVPSYYSDMYPNPNSKGGNGTSGSCSVIDDSSPLCF